MAKFANPELTPFCNWPEEKKEAFRWYAKSGGEVWFWALQPDEGWGKMTRRRQFLSNVVYTDDPKATHETPDGVANPDRIPLGEMSEADRVAIATAWARGEQLWVWVDDHWGGCSHTVLRRRQAYTTIDPNAKPEVDLNYPWEVLRDEIEWVAMDEDGEWRGHWFCTEEPHVDGTVWASDVGYDVLDAIKLDNKGLHWTKTLRRRPQTARGPI